MLLESEHQRLAVGQVAVPFGICTEPSNVQAGGGACPFRFRCLGCGHFRSDPSYLPELRDYLDTLLRDRERIRAATDLDDWARAEAMPSEAEITRLRQLIRRVEHDLDALDEADRRQIEHAVAIVRAHPPDRAPRPAHHRSPALDPHRRGPGVTSKPTNPLIAARRNDSDRRRRKVIDALDRLRTDGDEITVSAVARTAGVDRSFLYRHHDLRSQIHALAAEPDQPACTRTSQRSLLADLANLREHNQRLRHQNTKLTERLSEVLGEQVFHAGGIARTDETGTLRDPRRRTRTTTPRPPPRPPRPRRRTRRRPRSQPRPDHHTQQARHANNPSVKLLHAD